MPTQNVNLAEQQAAFIRKSVADGRYQNASEVVRASLRLLEQHEQQESLKLELLKSAVQRGLDDYDAGRFTELTPDNLDAVLDRVNSKRK